LCREQCDLDIQETFKLPGPSVPFKCESIWKLKRATAQPAQRKRGMDQMDLRVLHGPPTAKPNLTVSQCPEHVGKHGWHGNANLSALEKSGESLRQESQ
jgi:hypothetical protein